MLPTHPFHQRSDKSRQAGVALCFAMLPVVIIIGCTTLANAQPAKGSKPKYVRFPVQGDFESVLKDMLGRVKDGQQFKDEFHKLLKQLQNDPGLLKQLQNDPNRMPKGLKDLIEKLKLKNNPLIKQQFEDLIKQQNSKNLPIDDKQFQAIKDAFIKNWKFPDPNDPPGAKPPITPNGGGPNPPPVKDFPPNGGGLDPAGVGNPVANPPKPEPPKDDPFRDTLKEMLNDIGESDMADFLKDSEGFQNLLSDFGKLISSEENGFFDMDTEGFGEWLTELEAPQWDVDLPQPEGWPFGEMSMPTLPSINFKPPSLSAPSVGSPPPAESIAPTLLFLFLFFAAGVLLFYFLRSSSWSPLNRRGKLGWKIGPWPLDPARISTPGELIVAFNYLSKLFGGPQAETWNHKQAAETMAANGQDMSSTELASLYEQARYNPDEPLTHNDIHQARQHVSTLAGKSK